MAPRSVARLASVALLSLGWAVATDAPAGIAMGAVMWLLGGRAGTATAKMLFGQRLYRSAVDDGTRGRWLDREHRLIVAGYVTVPLIALLRLI